MYRSAFGVSVYSRLRVLGLFAAIELLLTHKPKGSDTGDSLTRQIAQKLPLLANRFAAPLHPANRFNVENAVGWKLIYHYRSLITHGGTVDFKRDYKKGKDAEPGVKELVNDREVLFFLEDFTRLVLRHALKEPRLVADLKAC